jgi:uncharacterized protein YdhG (YjbR/CyaY superfamily)
MSSISQIETYLRESTDLERAVLEEIRNQVVARYPDVEERYSYGIPCYYLRGKFLIGYTRNRRHFAVNTGRRSKQLQNLFQGYSTSKGTIRFTDKQPLKDVQLHALLDERASAILDSSSKLS